MQFGQKYHENQESTPRCDKKWSSKLYQNPNQQMIEEKSNQQMIEEKSNQQMIDSITHQHKRCDIKRNQINTTNDR